MALTKELIYDIFLWPLAKGDYFYEVTNELT